MAGVTVPASMTAAVNRTMPTDAATCTNHYVSRRLSSERIKMDVRDLNFYYGKFQALKNINLQIAEKKVTAFIGPSGCGKSTLLRVFNRMYELYPEQRAEGEVSVDGENILTSREDVALIRAKIGMIFQKPTPFPMSIYDNIAFGVKLFEKLSRSAMDERVEWALRKAALWTEVKDKLMQSGTSLSGGQQQRLCIARGIAVKPEIILLDEPCSALIPLRPRDRGIDRRVEKGLHGGDRDPQFAAGSTGVGLHRLHVSRRPGRVWRH